MQLNRGVGVIIRNQSSSTIKLRSGALAMLAMVFFVTGVSLLANHLWSRVLMSEPSPVGVVAELSNIGQSVESAIDSRLGPASSLVQIERKCPVPSCPASANEIAGRVIAEDGTPLPHWVITAKAIESQGSKVGGMVTDSDGSFRITNCRQGKAYLVEVHERNSRARTPAATCVVVPGSQEQVLRVPFSMMSKSWIQGVIRDEKGMVPKGARIVVSDEPQVELPVLVDAKTGTFLGGPFRAGLLELFVDAAGYTREDLGDRTLKFAETLDLGEIILPNAAMASGNIELSFAHAEGKPLEQVSVALLRESEAESLNPTFLRRDLCGGSLWRSGELSPGNYLAIIASASSGVGNVSQLVSVHPEETTRAHVVLSPARPTWLRIQASDGLPRPETFGNMCIRLRDALGRLVLCIDPAASVGIPYEFSPYLTPEMYRIEIVDSSGSLFSQAFEAQIAEGKNPLLITWAP